jgi:uncharacterized protein (UPF0335 family)
MAEIGDNSQRVVSEELNQFVQRIERIQDEIDVSKKDMKEVFAELKGRGYNAKIVRKIIALKKRNPDDVEEEKALLEMYGKALGLGIFA